MIFEVDHLYHIYNQGNNRQKIFFLKDNYHFFVKKIEEHFLPYSDILAWCLMPNHFHVMVYVKKLECPAIQGFTLSETLNAGYSSEKQYPQSCFEYIHDNPVKANLVKKPEDWEFSSYNEYFKSAGINARLINKRKAVDFGLV